MILPTLPILFGDWIPSETANTTYPSNRKDGWWNKIPPARWAAAPKLKSSVEILPAIQINIAWFGISAFLMVVSHRSCLKLLQGRKGGKVHRISCLLGANAKFPYLAFIGDGFNIYFFEFDRMVQKWEPIFNMVVDSLKRFVVGAIALIIFNIYWRWNLFLFRWNWWS